MQCCCCLGFDFDVQVRCATCRAAWCIRCNCNELRCLCPICDRAALNQTRPCSMCSQQVRIAKHGYECVECHVDNMCETCYRGRRCCARVEEDDDDMSTSTSESDDESFRHVFLAGDRVRVTGCDVSIMQGAVRVTWALPITGAVGTVIRFPGDEVRTYTENVRVRLDPGVVTNEVIALYHEGVALHQECVTNAVNVEHIPA